MGQLEIRKDQMAFVSANGEYIYTVQKDLDDKEAIYRVFVQDIEKRYSPREFLASNDFSVVKRYWRGEK